MGALEVSATLNITDSGATRVLDVEDLTALPVGAATSAKQDIQHADLAAILAKLSADPATAAGVAAIVAKLSTTISVASTSLTIADAVYEDGNLVTWTENGVDWEATYDSDGNLLTSNPA